MVATGHKVPFAKWLAKKTQYYLQRINCWNIRLVIKKKNKFPTNYNLVQLAGNRF